MCNQESNFFAPPHYQQGFIPRDQLRIIFNDAQHEVPGLNRSAFQIAFRTLPIDVECEGELSTDLTIVLAAAETSIPRRFYGMICREITHHAWNWQLLDYFVADTISDAVGMAEKSFYDYYGIDCQTLPVPEMPETDRTDQIEL